MTAVAGILPFADSCRSATGSSEFFCCLYVPMDCGKRPTVRSAANAKNASVNKISSSAMAFMRASGLHEYAVCQISEFQFVLYGTHMDLSLLAPSA